MAHLKVSLLSKLGAWLNLNVWEFWEQIFLARWCVCNQTNLSKLLSRWASLVPNSTWMNRQVLESRTLSKGHLRARRSRLSRSRGLIQRWWAMIKTIYWRLNITSCSQILRVGISIQMEIQKIWQVVKPPLTRSFRQLKLLETRRTETR